MARKSAALQNLNVSCVHISNGYKDLGIFTLAVLHTDFYAVHASDSRRMRCVYFSRVLGVICQSVCIRHKQELHDIELIVGI